MEILVEKKKNRILQSKNIFLLQNDPANSKWFIAKKRMKLKFNLFFGIPIVRKKVIAVENWRQRFRGWSTFVAFIQCFIFLTSYLGYSWISICSISWIWVSVWIRGLLSCWRSIGNVSRFLTPFRSKLNKSYHFEDENPPAKQERQAKL